MTVAELIQALEGLPQGDEVEFVQQPNYPLVAGLDHVEENGQGTVHIHLTEATGYFEFEEMT